MFRPPPLSRLEPEDLSYMTVKDAIQELRTATIYNKHHAIPLVRLPPDWGLVHRNEQMRLTGRSSLSMTGGSSPNQRSKTAPPMRSGASGRAGNPAGSPVGNPVEWATQSSTSSVPYRYQTSGGGQTSGLGPGSPGSPSALNSAYTYYYGTEPMNPTATNNECNRVGSLSMFGSQARSAKVSSASFGFGTATRDQISKSYISPAHLRENLCKFSPGPASRAADARSSLSKQILSEKRTYHSCSFGLEERFDPDRRFALATCTPGPGSYRI